MKCVKQFLNDTSGNFGTMTALLALPLIAVAGAAIDISYALERRSRLMGAADAAALAVISEGSAGQIAAISMTSEGRVAVAEKLGRDMFLRNAAANAMQLAAEDVETAVVRSSDIMNSSVAFTTQHPTILMHLMGFKYLTLAGTARASLAVEMPTFADYHFLLDNSPSMGLGATPKDIDALIDAVKAAKGGAGCAFACHEVWKQGGKPKTDSNFNIARANKITLRIDELRRAVLDTLAYADELQKGKRERSRFSAHIFGKSVEGGKYKIQQLSPLHSDIRKMRDAVEMLTLMETYGSGHNKDALTSIDAALTQVGEKITLPGGSGTSSTDREQIVLMVTDGVGDSLKPRNCTGVRDTNAAERCFEPIDPDYCDELKNRGIKIAVMYTTYYPLEDYTYERYVAKFADRIGPKLKQCASPSLYAEVTVKDDMSAVMKRLFERATGARKLRLTN